MVGGSAGARNRLASANKSTDRLVYSAEIGADASSCDSASVAKDASVAVRHLWSRLGFSRLPRPWACGVPRRAAWRAANFCWFLLFLTCAALQHNDPDPYLWLPIYGVACVFALVSTFQPELAANRIAAVLMALHLAVCLGLLGYLGYASLATIAPRPSLQLLNEEETAEAAGLLLVTGWLAAQLMAADLVARTRTGSARSCLMAGGLTCLMAAAGFPAMFWAARLLAGSGPQCPA